MNRKERRRLRRYGNRENYLRNRRHWAKAGPPVVMDDPTPEHVQALLTEWLIPKQVVEEVLVGVEKEMVKQMEWRIWDDVLVRLVHSTRPARRSFGFIAND